MDFPTLGFPTRTNFLEECGEGFIAMDVVYSVFPEI
jgi:hypothetical protein